MRRSPHIGTADEYAGYFAARPLMDHERAMLVAHAEAGVLTMREIARAAGWASHRPANRRYGDLAKKIRDFIGLPMGVADSGTPYHVLALFDDVGRNGEGELLLRLHDEVVDGLRQAGVIG